MKKGVVIALALFLLFFIPSFASSPGGVKICSVFYPCDSTRKDEVCPQDYQQDTSTNTVTFSQIICGGLGNNGAITGFEPSTKPITVDCNTCLQKHILRNFCSGGDVKSCKFCLNSAKCSQYALDIEYCPNSGICAAASGMLLKDSVQGTVNLIYSTYNDRDGEGKTCSINTDCCGYCSFGWHNELLVGHCCAEGRYWHERLGCQDAEPCGYTPVSQCPYLITDYRYWITAGCFYTDSSNKKYSCCPNTEAYGQTGIYYKQITIIDAE